MKELVGRRAFGKDKYIFASKGALHYKIDVFLDNRTGTGLSVDRLGIGQIDKKIVKRLAPVGAAMGERLEKEFRGWAPFPVQTFHKFCVPTLAVGEDNPYHAEINRDNYPTPASLRALAFEICVAATDQDFIPCPAATL